MTQAAPRTFDTTIIQVQSKSFLSFAHLIGDRVTQQSSQRSVRLCQPSSLAGIR